MYKRLLTALIFSIFLSQSYAQKVAVVDIQKVFDGYQKAKEARERLDKSKKIAMEEIDIYRAEMEKITKELKEMDDKIKNPHIDSTALRDQFQKKIEKAKVKQEDRVAYERRAQATIAQRQKNMVVEHLADIRAAAQKVADAKGLDLIINSSEPQLFVFYARDKYDVTEEVIITLNASPLKK